MNELVPAAPDLKPFLQPTEQALEAGGRPWLRKRAGPPAIAEIGHSDWVTSVAFSPDGRRVLSGSRDDTVKIWDADSGALLADCRGHSESVTSVAFSPDGRRVLSGSRDGTVKIWDGDSGTCLATLFFSGQVAGTILIAAPSRGDRESRSDGSLLASDDPLRLVVADTAGNVFTYQVGEPASSA